VRNAKHLPDVRKHVLDKASNNANGHVLHLTYEEATALNELAAWNVHTDADGNVTPGISAVRRSGTGDPYTSEY